MRAVLFGSRLYNGEHPWRLRWREHCVKAFREKDRRLERERDSECFEMDLVFIRGGHCLRVFTRNHYMLMETQFVLCQEAKVKIVRRTKERQRGMEGGRKEG